MSEITKIVIVTLLGLVFGSFVNAWVWRLRQTLDDEGEPRKLTTKQKKQLSIVTARSMCPNCKHELSPIDLVPVFSWLALGGKCRYCKKPISKQYPLVELVTAILFGLSAYFWDFSLSYSWAGFVTWLVCLVALIALAIYDLRYTLLPNKIIYKFYSIAVLGLAVQFLLGKPIAGVKQTILSVLISGGIFWLIYQVSQGRWIGGGDVKLGFLLGLLIPTGWLALLMLFIASLLGSLVSLPLLASKKISRTAHIPFGPFLIISTIIVVLYGQNILNWYTNLLSLGI